MPKLRVLFICGRNQKRSPTAARIFQNDSRMEVRSAGTSDSSRRKVSEGDLQWAELIVVMERKYAARLRAGFDHVAWPRIETLEIPDEYEFMDPELVELLRDGLDPILTSVFAEENSSENSER
jgi:predicted protein tyrosine phosphatase